MTGPNVSAIFSRTGAIGIAAALTTASADYLGTNINNQLVFTADANNGGFIERLRFKAIGTNGNAVARIFINNGFPPFISLVTPGAPTGTPAATGGSIPTSTTYFGALAARDAYGGWSPAGTASSAQSTTGPNASIAWTWSAVANAFEYRIYLSSTASGAYTNYYTISNCPNVWGYVTGTSFTTGGTIAAGSNFAMVNIQTTLGTFLLPCTTSGITTTGSTSTILWTAPIIAGMGTVISYDWWFSTSAITPGTGSINHTGAQPAINGNTYSQTAPATSFTGGTAPTILAWTETQPVQFYQSGIIAGATNNTFFGEQTLTATTGSTTAGTVDIDYPMNFPLPFGYRIYVGLGASVLAGWTVTPIGGSY